MKKLLSLTLCAVMALSLSATTLAAETKNAALTVNGVEVVTSGMPKSTLVPLRAVVEADHGNVNWNPEDNTAIFSTSETQVEIDLTTKAITVDRVALTQKVPQVEIIDGVTFVEDSLFALMGTYVIERDAAKNTVDIKTQNNSAIAKTAYGILEAVELPHLMRAKNANLEEYYKLDPTWFTEVICFSPMIVRSDTLYIGKVTPGNMEKVEAAFKGYQDQQIATFTWYLGGDVLKIAQEGKIVKNGDYVMLIMSGNNDKAIEIFNGLK